MDKVILREKDKKTETMTEHNETNDTETAHQTKIIINSIKYLKKAIKRLPKEVIDDVNKRRLFSNYNELVDIIIEHIS